MSEELNFRKAITEFQKKMKPPKKDRVNAFYKSAAHPNGYPYASLDSIYDAIREPLSDCGLYITHDVKENILHTTLWHISDASISNSIPIFADKNTPAGFASALTYARRLAVSCLLCISSDDDDDGNAADIHNPKRPYPKKSEMSLEEFRSQLEHASNILNLNYTFDGLKEFLEELNRTNKVPMEDIMKKALDPKNTAKFCNSWYNWSQTGN